MNKALKGRLVYEAKELSKMKFEDLPTEKEWAALAHPLEDYEI